MGTLAIATCSWSHSLEAKVGCSPCTLNVKESFLYPFLELDCECLPVLENKEDNGITIFSQSDLQLFSFTDLELYNLPFLLMGTRALWSVLFFPVIS